MLKWIVYVFTNVKYIVKMEIEKWLLNTYWKDDNVSKSELRKIPMKNYIILGVVVLVTLISYFIIISFKVKL